MAQMIPSSAVVLRFRCEVQDESWEGIGECPGCAECRRDARIRAVNEALEARRFIVPPPDWREADKLMGANREFKRRYLGQWVPHEPEIEDPIVAAAAARLAAKEGAEPLAKLLAAYEQCQREQLQDGTPGFPKRLMSFSARAAAAEWSRQLREKVAASAAAAKERERTQVVLDYDY
jgi:hypothetical protein